MNFQIQRTEDVGFLNRMANHPDIGPFIRDDRCVTPQDYRPAFAGNNVVLQVTVDGVDAAFAVLLGWEHGLYEMHSGVLPEFRGRPVVAMGKLVVDWAMTHLDCSTLSTWAWEHARHTRLMARAVGFRETGRAPWPHPVDGRMVRRVLYELTRPEWSAAQPKEELSTCP